MVLERPVVCRVILAAEVVRVELGVALVLVAVYLCCAVRMVVVAGRVVEVVVVVRS